VLPLLKVAKLREYRSQPHSPGIAGEEFSGGQAHVPAGGGQPGGRLWQRPGAERHREVHRGAGLLAGAQRRAEPRGGARAELEAAEAGELAELVAEPLGQLGGDQLGRGQAGGDACPLGDAEQGGLHLVGRQLPRLVGPVQGGGVPGEPALPVGEPAVQR
jgi:hypothetical protein